MIYQEHDIKKQRKQNDKSNYSQFEMYKETQI